MVKEYKTYTCNYTVEWPVDGKGRLGGLYSSANLPIAGYTEMEREGILLSQDTRREIYEVQDVLRKTVKRIVPFNKVSKITEIKKFQNESDK
jgi:hypothetical protein